MQPWFEDPDAILLTKTGGQTAWPKKKKPRPEIPDIRETALFVWSHPHARPFFVGIFILFALNFVGRSTVTLITTKPVAVLIVVLLLPLVVVTLTTGLFLPLRRVVLGESIAFADGMKSTIRNLPSIAITSLFSGIVVSIGFVLFIIPGFIVLPFVVRAPYEAALGASPFNAFKRAFKTARLDASFAAAGSNFVIDALLAGLLIDAIQTELSIVSPTSAFVFQLIAIALLQLVLIVSLVAVFVTTDAALAGALNDSNLAAHRIKNYRFWDRFFLSKPFRAFRGLSPIFVLPFIMFAFSGPPEFLKLIQAPSVAGLPPVGKPVPPFELEKTDGSIFKSSELKGKPSVIYGWAPWCTPCSGQVIALHRLVNGRPDDFNVVSVALSYGNRDEVTQYIADKSVRFDVLYGDDTFWPDNPIQAFPTVVTLDANGIVTGRWTGITTGFTLTKTLDR